MAVDRIDDVCVGDVWVKTRCSNVAIALAIVVSGAATSWCRICERTDKADRVLRTAVVRG